MAIQVTSIPATKSRFTSKLLEADRKRKVAGYARVSTDRDEQFTSFEAQVNYYTRFIKGHSDWVFVKIYTDEGISATNTLHREGFNQMIDDALNGKIDMIVTKSISRFARNTVDSLTTIRKLKDHGIEVYFEKENIWTLDSQSELLITLLSSIAQEESRSMSDNIRWAVNKKFEKGQFSLPYRCFLGYDKGPDGRPVINEGQAKIVREIYYRFLAGQSPHTIKLKLEAEGITAPRGGTSWSETTINSILRNEKYSGNAVLQKSFTADFLTKKKVVNNGEVPKYYVQDSHEAIIPQEVYDLVQSELASRSSFAHFNYDSGVFSGKLICGGCGAAYGAKTWHSTGAYRSTIYRCNRKYSSKTNQCNSPHITEKKLKSALTNAINNFMDRKKFFIENAKILEKTVFSTKALESRKTELDMEIGILNELYHKEVTGKVIKDAQRLNDIQERYSCKLEERDGISKEIADKRRKSLELKRVVKKMTSLHGIMTEFSENAFVELVERVTVFPNKTLTVTFRSGDEITVCW